MPDDTDVRGIKRNIISITRMTVHNGPGIRTLVLFKGCPLRCLWCSTPESQNTYPELAVFSNKCIHCNKCLDTCHKNAIRMTDDSLTVDRVLCDNCGECVRVCNAEALKIIGSHISVDELVEEIEKDRPFFRNSGGVTLSGGEPLLNRDFNLKLLSRLKEHGINVGIDTCGYVTWNDIKPLLPYVAFFLLDIKHMDSEEHRKLTGVSNELILKNARTLSNRNIPQYIRIPIIPGYNDSEQNLRETFSFAASLTSLVEVNLLPLHHLGKARYISLGRNYPIDNLPLLADEFLWNLKELAESFGLKCLIVN